MVVPVPTQCQGIATLDNIQVLEEGHAQQHPFTRHIRYYGCGHLATLDPTQRHAVQFHQVTPNDAGGGMAGRGYAAFQLQPGRDRSWNSKISGPGIHQKFHRLPIDTTGGDIVPVGIALQHHFLLPRPGNTAFELLIRIVTLVQQAAEVQGQQGQRRHPEQTEHPGAKAVRFLANREYPPETACEPAPPVPGQAADRNAAIARPA